ncbi:hypothetical protein D3C76_1668530 [compost metagenome]
MVKSRGKSVKLFELRSSQAPILSIGTSPLRNTCSTGILDVSCSPSGGVVLSSFIMVFSVSSHLVTSGWSRLDVPSALV